LATLLAGTALNALYNVGYINWLALGNYHRILQINLTALIIAIVLIPIFVSWQGTIGGAFGWLAINIIGLTLSFGWIFQKKNEREN
jgi:O-antigen/teichoic acid export membrane protein